MVNERPNASFSAPRWAERLLWVIAALVAVVAIATAISLIPVKYVIQGPGPTVNVLGSQVDTPVLEFSQSGEDAGVQVRPETADEGELRMVTVSSLGGPGTTVRVGDIVRAWMQPGTSIRPYYELYDSTVTADDVAQAGQAQMQSSHSAASIAAMDYLGLPMETTLSVVGTVPGSGADGVLEEGDIVLALATPDGVVHPISSPSVPFTIVEDTPPGSTLTLTIQRDGEEKNVDIITSAPEPATTADEDGVGDSQPPAGSRMGVYLSADTEAPLNVSIHLERIGGPSAGLIFALGIIDQLTPGGITGGEDIAGTGALDFAGNVIPIGGVVQKMYGAQRDGSEWFLIPADNCAEAVGNEPAGLRVVPVRTLRDAVSVVEEIASGQDTALPSCPTR